MFQLFNYPTTGQYVHLVTGLYPSCFSDGIPDIQGLSSIYVQATHAHVLLYINAVQIMDIRYTIR